MKNYIQIEPVRTLSAVLAFGAAVIILIALLTDLSGEVVAAIQGVWAAFIAVIGSVFVRNEVTPTGDA